MHQTLGLEQLSKDHLDLNDIALVDVELSQSVVIDPYQKNRATGAFIIIDRLTNITVAAGMVTKALESSTNNFFDSVDTTEFEEQLKALINKHFPNKGDDELTTLVKKLTGYCQ